jgi:hypothetical protein
VPGQLRPLVGRSGCLRNRVPTSGAAEASRLEVTSCNQPINAVGGLEKNLAISVAVTVVSLSPTLAWAGISLLVPVRRA